MKFDSTEYRSLRDRKLALWFGGDPDALEVFHIIAETSEVWDDAIDMDKSIPIERLSGVFENISVKLSMNPFWQTYAPYLNPIVWLGVNAWLDSVELERMSGTIADYEMRRPLVYWLKTIYTELIPAIILCTGGWNYLRSVSLDVHQFFHHEILKPQWHAEERNSLLRSASTDSKNGTPPTEAGLTKPSQPTRLPKASSGAKKKSLRCAKLADPLLPSTSLEPSSEGSLEPNQ